MQHIEEQNNLIQKEPSDDNPPAPPASHLTVFWQSGQDFDQMDTL